MELIEATAGGAVLRLSLTEFLALKSALNESLEALEDWEFEIRMGVSQREVCALLAESSRMVKAVNQKTGDSVQ